MDKTRLIVLLCALALPCLAQTPARNVVDTPTATTTGSRAWPTTETIPSGFATSYASGSTITVSGVFAGTPTGGTLNLSNTTLTLPSGTYALLAGASGGQTLNGGTGSGESLTLSSTAHATKGKIYFGAAQTSAYNGTNDRLGLGTNAPSYPLHVFKAANSTVSGYILNNNGGDAAIAEWRAEQPGGTIAIQALSGAYTTSGVYIASAGVVRSEGTGGLVLADIGGGGIKFSTAGTTEKARLDTSGRLGIGVTPTALLHLKAGTTSGNTAPIKLTSGSLMSSAEAGAIEFLTDGLYYTQTTGTTRQQIASLAGTETLTNKTVNLSSNTLTATSAQLATAVSDETGSGALVFATSPTLVTPSLGAATVTTINGNTIGTGSIKISSGTGSPEGAVVGSVGDIFLRTNGGANTTLYVKESGSASNTGWVGK